MTVKPLHDELLMLGENLVFFDFLLHSQVRLLLLCLFCQPGLFIALIYVRGNKCEYGATDNGSDDSFHQTATAGLRSRA
jgi:hypothetical protein